MEMVSNLTALKRYFKAGGRVELVEYLYHDKPTDHANLFTVRKPEIVQTNGVMFEGGSWLMYGVAKDWQFKLLPNNGVHAINDCGFCKLTYYLLDCC